jgi:CelD/BcsL family acetyltransferase involved in cellulose biosynthesis
MLAACAEPLVLESALSVAEVNDTATFRGLRDEWNELLADSDSNCFFLTWEWLYSWWENLAESRQLQILTVRAQGRLIAIAPFALRSPSLSSGHPYPVLEFLGSGYAGSDYLDIIVRKHFERQAVEAIAVHLGQRECMVKWTNLSPQAQVGGLASKLSESGWSCESTVTNLCPYIPLEGKTWPSYLAELSSQHRYDYHRKLRRLNREFTVTFERALAPRECSEALDLLIELHNSRRSTLGGSDAFHTPELRAFHHELVIRAMDRGWLRLFVLKLNGKPAAALYGLNYGEKFYFYQSGFDPAYNRWSVGLITMGLSIQAAIEEGAHEYDLLHGDEPYKSHWSRHSRDLTRFELFPPGLVGQLFHGSVDLLRSARQVAHSLLMRTR